MNRVTSDEWTRYIPAWELKSWVVICLCFSGAQAQTHVSYRRYKMYWYHKSNSWANKLTNACLIKTHGVGTASATLDQVWHRYNMVQAFDWDQYCKFKTYRSHSLCLSLAHEVILTPVHHWAQNQQTASAEQTTGSLCHSWGTRWSVEPRNNKQPRQRFEPSTRYKTCNWSLAQTKSERDLTFPHVLRSRSHFRLVQIRRMNDEREDGSLFGLGLTVATKCKKLCGAMLSTQGHQRKCKEFFLTVGDTVQDCVWWLRHLI